MFLCPIPVTSLATSSSRETILDLGREAQYRQSGDVRVVASLSTLLGHARANQDFKG